MPAAARSFGDPLVIPLRYFLRVRNVGDRLSPEIVRAVTGRATFWTADAERLHLLGVGSILSNATAASLVWGAGLMHPSFGIGSPHPTRILALRGKHTLEMVEADLGVKLGEVPLGDPAYLAACVYRVPAVRGRFALGVVPHYVDQMHPFIRALSADDGVKILDVHAEPEEFIRALVECEFVVSSSLHGLVLAESFGIPNAWIVLSDQVAGEGFKFRDWFSLARRPQLEPLIVNSSLSVRELISVCRLHEMMIDRASLMQALRDKVSLFDDHAFGEPDVRKIIYPVRECRRRPIPIFIISFNRGRYLYRVVKSYKRLSTPVEIIIHDNGSFDKHTLEILDKLESEGAKVYRRSRINSADELMNVNETISDYFAGWAEPQPYVVTDCDVEMSDTAPDALEVYALLLDNFREVDCVGPMLSIHDIPSTYPLYAHVLNRHIEQFWHKKPLWFKKGNVCIAYQEALIDTTFALCRAGQPFKRPQKALRVYYPYEARHLDWYRTATKGDIYYATSSSEISHWNNCQQEEQFKNETLKYDQFIRVVEIEDGTLRAVVQKILI